MISSISVRDDENNYELSTLLNDDGTPDKESTSLTFYIYGETDAGISREVLNIWDNVDYLKTVVYPYLIGSLCNSIYGSVEESFDEMEDVFSNVKDVLLEMFQEAEKLGMI